MSRPAPLPSLTALRAFEAAARTLSFSEAGREMNVSHAAVAQSVRKLEAELGRPLLRRAGRGLALTADGALLARGVTEGFDRIRATLEAFEEEDAARPVRVTLTPNFAVGFLIPRLGGFRRAHPEVQLDIDPSARVVDLAEERMDLAIRYGAGGWPGVESRLLVPSPRIITAAPSLIAGREVRRYEDLAAFPWLQEQGTEEMTRWLAEKGVTGLHGVGGAYLPGYMIHPALLDGQGVALSGKVFVQADLDAGRLVKLFEDEDPDGRLGYHIVRRPGPERPGVQAFTRWLRREAARPGGAGTMALSGRT
ncbi:LysR substrate-binding domain-containing protein [Albimonas pacifica]|uniref:LysR family transcriptional regulator, glycine cleavage system transcriptional activator n=1 Tax=Albimonas pacifica TaxID=1114924 RepID=A0A1I3F4E6_9RHOB|nr:LysR substrate-binding domain-containing protein [Albimonas pacifica]SFI06077.1 LysR family transcriptional regulator, glycine cleavage system transcriptional activator [Albimonas pacifica]